MLTTIVTCYHADSAGRGAQTYTDTNTLTIILHLLLIGLKLKYKSLPHSIAFDFLT
jgi:hypothetical protein